MKAYFDTNVLVAALHPDHEHHPASVAAYASVLKGQTTGYISAHGLMEFYSVISRSPLSRGISVADAETAIAQSIMPYFNVFPVSVESHLAALRSCVAGGWRGGRIHDAVHVQAAVQTGCDVLYTFNTAHFEQLARGWPGRVVRPEQQG